MQRMWGFGQLVWLGFGVYFQIFSFFLIIEFFQGYSIVLEEIFFKGVEVKGFLELGRE